MELLDPMYEDLIKVKENQMTDKEFKTKYKFVKKEKIDELDQYINLNTAMCDIIMIINKASDRVKQKLQDFTEVLVKNYYEKKKIKFMEWNGQQVVSVEEGKLSYIKGDEPKLIRVYLKKG